jgi:hypothetical protein
VDDGKINAFDPISHNFLGQLADPAGKTIAIQGATGGLWGLVFGGGTTGNGETNQLFFSAGPNSYLDGLFGVILATGEGDKGVK